MERASCVAGFCPHPAPCCLPLLADLTWQPAACHRIICDILGPRRGVTFLLWVTTPAIVGMMFVQSAAAWIACRCIIGLSLATFVCSQVWCSQMYAKSVVGIANATSAGWGNLGGGVTNLLMPYIFLGFYGAVSGNSGEPEPEHRTPTPTPTPTLTLTLT